MTARTRLIQAIRKKKKTALVSRKRIIRRRDDPTYTREDAIRDADNGYDLARKTAAATQTPKARFNALLVKSQPRAVAVVVIFYVFLDKILKVSSDVQSFFQHETVNAVLASLTAYSMAAFRIAGPLVWAAVWLVIVCGAILKFVS